MAKKSQFEINQKAQQVFQKSVASGNSEYKNGPAREGGLPPTQLYSSPTSGSSAALSSSDLFSGSISGLLKEIQSLTDKNNQWSAEQAQKQMDFQQASADKAMKFEHDEADLSRKWQEYMSNTAHQREIKDLQAAGLNPVLSATGGQGAPVTSGATASGYSGQGAKGDTDTSGAGSLVSLLGSMLQAQTSLLAQSMSAQSALAVADKYTAATRFGAQLSANTAERVAQLNYQQGTDVAMINRGTQVQVASINLQSNVTAAQIHGAATQAAAKISGEYHLSASQQSSLASIINASIGASASRYGTDVKSWTDREVASANRDLQERMQQAGFDQQLLLQFNDQRQELELNTRGFLQNAALTAEKGFFDIASKLAPFIPLA